jgi:hypothetical protein
MPALKSTDDKIAPKSILRHRPIGESTPPKGKRSMVTTAATPIVQRASRPRPVIAEDEVAEWRHTTGDEGPSKPVPGRRHTTTFQFPAVTSLPKAGLFKKGALQHTHPLFFLGIGMLIALVLWTVSSLVFGWITTTLDDIHYGRPRTFQTDAWVGHSEQSGIPSHFIAINLHGHIEVIEMPGGDATHAHVYLGPQLYSSDSELVPVTLQFVDVNGDHKLDMLITFQGTHAVFINDGQQFRPVLPNERPQVEQFLEHLGK